MEGVGVLARFEVAEDRDADVIEFFASGRAIVETQPASTIWFAYRVGPTTYGAFAAFTNDADRQALLSSGGPTLSRENADLFTEPPSFALVEIIATRR